MRLLIEPYMVVFTRIITTSHDNTLKKPPIIIKYMSLVIS